MIRHLGILFIAALLAFGLPFHAAIADGCLTSQEEVTTHHREDASHCPDGCKHGHAGMACQTACSNVAALPDHVPGLALSFYCTVAFFPNGGAYIPSVDVSPEPFPPRASALS